MTFSSAHAQVIFTFNTTALSTAEGYTSGQSYSFAYTLKSSVLYSSSDLFTSSANQWQNFSPADSPIFSDVTGALLGNYTPLPNSSYEYLWNNTTSSGFLILSAGRNDAATGLATLSGTPIKLITGNVAEWPAMLLASYPGAYTDPTFYWTGLQGTYATSNANINIDGVSSFLAAFTVTSLTISVIPEPSTFVILLGTLTLISVIVRRKAKPMQANPRGQVGVDI